MNESEMERLRQVERDKYTRWYYENEYWKEDNPNKVGDRYHYDDADHSKRFGFLAGLIARHFNFGTFLDVGCGLGHVLKNLLDMGYIGKGTEVSAAALARMEDLARKGVVMFAGAEKLPFEDSSFDTVICLDVMEHLPGFDIDRAIYELTRTSKRYLILTINLDNPYEYHPSMLPRIEWERRFLKNNSLMQLAELQKRIEHECKQRYPEYEFFIFEKI